MLFKRRPPPRANPLRLLMSQFKRALFLQLTGPRLGGPVVWLARHFPLLEYAHHAQQKLGAMQFWGGVLYPMLYGACNVLLPLAGVVAIGSGLFFGLCGAFQRARNVAGAAVAFARPEIRSLGGEEILSSSKWVALEVIARDGWKIIFLSQVHPLFPSSLLNYPTASPASASGLACSGSGRQAPGLFYAYLGTPTQHGIRLLRGKSDPHPMEHVIWIGGLWSPAATTALGRIALVSWRGVEAVAKPAAPSELEAAKQCLPPVAAN